VHFNGARYEVIKWVNLTLDMKVQNRAVLTMVMNPRFHKRQGICQVFEVFCSILLINQLVLFC
jgi:hypothetical protein